MDSSFEAGSRQQYSNQARSGELASFGNLPLNLLGNNSCHSAVTFTCVSEKSQNHTALNVSLSNNVLSSFFFFAPISWEKQYFNLFSCCSTTVFLLQLPFFFFYSNIILLLLSSFAVRTVSGLSHLFHRLIQISLQQLFIFPFPQNGHLVHNLL